MDEPRIQDLPTFQKLLRDSKNIALVAKWLPWFRVFLRLLGVDMRQVEAALADAANLHRAVDELAAIPDRFNDLLSSRGWVMYESFSLEVAKAAIAAVEAGDHDRAERVLVDYYSAETVARHLFRMKHLEAFAPRFRLAQKALADYTEGRYHACIPVLLALLDGFVDDLGERGFFATGVDLSAWDSIAAHDKGLAQLARIFQQGRRKTRTDAISIPYRHGILHGKDLGYDNELVAAKCWAALFVAGDWAFKITRGEKEAPPPDPEPSLLDALQRLQEVQEDRERLASWRARDMKVGRDIPASGDPSQYPEDTPERRLAEFLVLWKARNYGRMTGYIWMNERSGRSTAKLAGEVREAYGSKPLLGYRLVEVTDVASAITVIKTACTIGEHDREEPIDFRLLYEDERGNSVVRGKPGGMWNIVNWVRL